MDSFTLNNRDLHRTVGLAPPKRTQKNGILLDTTNDENSLLQSFALNLTVEDQ